MVEIERIIQGQAVVPVKRAGEVEGIVLIGHLMRNIEIQAHPLHDRRCEVVGAAERNPYDPGDGGLVAYIVHKQPGQQIPVELMRRRLIGESSQQQQQRLLVYADALGDLVVGQSLEEDAHRQPAAAPPAGLQRIRAHVRRGRGQPIKDRFRQDRAAGVERIVWHHNLRRRMVGQLLE
jgi:hypothetical protein